MSTTNTSNTSESKPKQALQKPSNANMVALLIMHAVLDSIDAAGDQGAPDGVIYAALMSFGATLDQHTRLINMLTEQGLATKSGNLLRLTEAGRTMLNKLSPLSGLQ